MSILLTITLLCSAAGDAAVPTVRLDLPDQEIAAAYRAAAEKNVLAAVNPDIFPGYWSVCADGIGHGHGNTFPALDGHQMADALLFLGQADTVKANWDYVKSFQRIDGQLPFAILPASAGKAIGPPENHASVDPNGGLYSHWVPDNPLRALGYSTYIQNADVLFRMTQDRDWLAKNLPSVNLAAEYLAAMTTAEGAVGGAGYYVERPTRVEYDGVTQGHAVDAFRRLAALNLIAGNTAEEKRFRELADRIQSHFQTRFWAEDHFAEYIHPKRGPIATHGLTDTDWSAIATGVATGEQQDSLWPRLVAAQGFRYGGMPTGIATKPENYETWEFSHDDRMDLAAMGRVWYIECWARGRMNDGIGLVNAILPVCAEGKVHDYYWRERYGADGGYGVEKYCEYPANLIRIVQRFLLGVDYHLDGSLVLAPRVPSDWWQAGFGQTLSWRGHTLDYRFEGDRFSGNYTGDEGLVLHLRRRGETTGQTLTEDSVKGDLNIEVDGDWLIVTFPPTLDRNAISFDVSLKR